MNEHVTFFQIPIDIVPDARIQTLITESLSGRTTTTIATVNPEMLLAAKRSPSISHALRRMTYCIPDGFGITLMACLLGQGVVRRHPGSDLFVDVCRHSALDAKRVLILGGWGTTTERAIQVLKAAYPHLDVVGLSDVSIRWEDDAWDQPDDLLETIAHLRPDVLAVALGGEGHRQERWIADHTSHIPGLKLALGVGGTINMVAGITKRAPAFMRRVGLEWLWRLWLEPRRIGRIVRAVFVFPTFAILDRMSRHEE